jgi:hypothetical protein
MTEPELFQVPGREQPLAMEERAMLRSIDLGDVRPFRPAPRADPATLFREQGRRWQVLRDLLVGAAVLALWLVLWTWAAATVTEPWAPDPETRAAMAEIAQRP